MLSACAQRYGHEYTEPVDILEDDGEVAARGWAREPLFRYERDHVAVSEVGNLREWDFYTVLTPDFAVNVTLATLRLDETGLVLGAVTVHDFLVGEAAGPSLFAVDGDGDVQLDEGPGGSYEVAFGSATLAYGLDGDVRTVDVTAEDDVVSLRIGPPAGEVMALVTPFPTPGSFFYEVKAPCLPVSGTLRAGGRDYVVPDGSFAVMDFARGTLPEETSWDWATGMGLVDGHLVGVNLGTVNGDEERGTPNAVIVDGVLHKLGRVTWTWDPDELAAPWRFVDEEGRLDLTLVGDEARVELGGVDLGLYQNQVWKLYGAFEGTVELDDGTRQSLDGVLGAAEHFEATW